MFVLGGKIEEVSMKRNHQRNELKVATNHDQSHDPGNN